MTGTTDMRFGELLRVPYARRLASAAVLGGLTLGLSPVGVVLFIEQQRGSYALAGGVLAAFGVGRGIATPVQGRLLEERSTERTLRALATAHVLAVGALIWFGSSELPAVTAILAAALAGASFPPLPALLRAWWPRLVGHDEHRLVLAYAFDAMLAEAMFFGGLLLASLLLVAFEPVAVLIAMAASSAAGALLWRPPDDGAERPQDRSRTASARRNVWLLVATWGPVSFALGAFEVLATAGAQNAGESWLAAMVLALSGAGNVAGSSWFGRRGGTMDPAWVLRVSAISLTAIIALLAVSSGLPVLVATSLLIGAPYGPFAATNGRLLVHALAGVRTTEAFAWCTTATMAGGALGAAVAGSLVEQASLSTAALICGLGGTAAAAILAWYSTSAHAARDS